MKKILTMVAFSCALLFQGQTAQSQTYKVATITSGDTLTNADTAYATINTENLIPPITFMASIKKISGTLAGGSTLWYSNDNVFYWPSSTTDTMINANPATYNGISQVSKRWEISATAALPRYVQLRSITTGTSVGILKFTAYEAKHAEEISLRR